MKSLTQNRRLKRLSKLHAWSKLGIKRVTWNNFNFACVTDSEYRLRVYIILLLAYMQSLVCAILYKMFKDYVISNPKAWHDRTLSDLFLGAKLVLTYSTSLVPSRHQICKLSDQMEPTTSNFKPRLANHIIFGRVTNN